VGRVGDLVDLVLVLDFSDRDDNDTGTASKHTVSSAPGSALS
jgi:hypothetical protein